MPEPAFANKSAATAGPRSPAEGFILPEDLSSIVPLLVHAILGIRARRSAAWQADGFPGSHGPDYRRIMAGNG
jgi:hypothetical protein